MPSLKLMTKLLELGRREPALFGCRTSRPAALRAKHRERVIAESVQDPRHFVERRTRSQRACRRRFGGQPFQEPRIRALLSEKLGVNDAVLGAEFEAARFEDRKTAGAIFGEDTVARYDEIVRGVREDAVGGRVFGAREAQERRARLRFEVRCDREVFRGRATVNVHALQERRVRVHRAQTFEIVQKAVTQHLDHQDERVDCGARRTLRDHLRDHGKAVDHLDHMIVVREHGP
jgi:hypothetical protein